MFMLNKGLQFNFFSEDMVEKFFHWISWKIDKNPKRISSHQRCFPLVKFLLHKSVRIDEALQSFTAGVDLSTIKVRKITFMQRKDKLKEIMWERCLIRAHKLKLTIIVEVILVSVFLNVLQKRIEHSSIFITSVFTQILGMDKFEFMERVSETI